MLVDAMALCSIGLIATLLPATETYARYLVRRVARRADAVVPAEQAPALRARARRRARAVGAGILAAGLIWLAVTLLWPEAGEQPSGGYVVVSLLFVSGAAGLAAVEILRPGDVAAGPRWARSTAPTLADYLAPQARLLTWVLVAVGLVGLAGTLLLTQSRWFDASTIWRSPALFLLAAVPVLVILSELAVRRVLSAPQPARDEHELYWQDALRAHTLNSLIVPPALVSMLALVVSGAALDDAASAAAVASGQVGPAWSTGLLIGGYVLPLLLVIGALAAAAALGDGDDLHFQRRLWPTGGPVDAAQGAS